MNNPPPTATEAVEVQEELLPALLADLDPDVYVVIPVSVLSRQLSIDWNKVAAGHRGEVRLGWLQLRFMRSINQLGFLHNTKRPEAKP